MQNNPALSFSSKWLQNYGQKVRDTEQRPAHIPQQTMEGTQNN